METARKQARHLKRGERIVFDFRGSPNHLGEVEIFDIDHLPGGFVQLVLVTKDRTCKYRKVSGTTPFFLR